MKYLLDTHILIWAFSDVERLSKKAFEVISDKENQIFYSILSIFEVEWKYIHRPQGISLNGKQFLKYCDEAKFIQVSLKAEHIFELQNLTRSENFPPHKDPFDKLMLAQSIIEEMIFITHDKRIAEYDAKNILSA